MRTKDLIGLPNDPDPIKHNERRIANPIVRFRNGK